MPEQRQQLRRDLRGLVVLELLQRAIAIGSLLAVAGYAAAVADRRVAISIALAVVLSLAYLAQAFRIRMGQELIRRDLYALELREELDAGETESQTHPYRSCAGRTVRRARSCGLCDVPISSRQYMQRKEM